MSEKKNQIISRGFEYGVHHLLTARPGPLFEVLSEMLNLSTDQVQDLCALGAIYVQGERISQLQNYPEQTYVRVHSKPRRFPVQKIDWKKTVHFEHPDFLIINKPAGIPCHASVDNIQENLLSSLKNLRQENLYITHRLDVVTSGLLVVARNLKFQSFFNRALSEKRVHKFYQAICTRKAPSKGLHRHYMIDGFGSPKKLSLNPDEGLRCELEVLNVVSKGDNFEAEIELLTGRTHQIRAQMAFLGSPLENDILYGAEKVFPDERIGLSAKKIIFSDPETDKNFCFALDV